MEEENRRGEGNRGAEQRRRTEEKQNRREEQRRRTEQRRAEKRIRRGDTHTQTSILGIFLCLQFRVLKSVFRPIASCDIQKVQFFSFPYVCAWNRHYKGQNAKR